ncbi:cytochrome c4 [Hyphomicrobium sp.]|uniref:c-type cytochrome n=1 Tax=Hyphomicrobium sp. TaxID=82 RepID=UPI002D790108|nr:cytochrome c4 [Hyphomicrobium sp.]HET6390440.1 cytochrome c4 [Hyphomicrobium sp.]
MMSMKCSLPIAIGVLVAAFTAMPRLAFADSVEENAQTCAGCHGESGIPQEKTTPVIWGQNEGYLYLQLRDFKSGARKNDIMSGVVAGLEKADFKALAAHFASLKWPNIQQPSPPKDVTKAALTVIGSIGCTSCHLDQYQGDGSTARLAGQQAEYLLKTMTDFRDGSRGNNPGMSDLMKAAQPADLGPISQYLASLQVIGGNGDQ